ncbi:hypothetical protein BDN70DRAFT_870188 [Pholiota conissans]|uniref:Uncharacterized protein n=1 Tax=Pholiota conissans TaxID=109636 RepID=A0A9P5ZGC4_9AGAR|nr:hypothetical protein BDN70DRAFT_870188 [Pholiota conissans]
MSSFGGFGNSGRKDKSGYAPTRTQDDDDNTYISPTQGSFAGGNPSVFDQGGYGGAGSGGDDSNYYGGGGGFQDDPYEAGNQGNYGGRKPSLGFGGQGRSSGYDQGGGGQYGANNQQGNWGSGGNTDFRGNDDNIVYDDDSYKRGYGAGPGVPGTQPGYGNQGSQGQVQNVGQNQPQQKEKGGILSSAKSLYKDIKKDKTVSTDDDKSEGRSNFF